MSARTARRQPSQAWPVFGLDKCIQVKAHFAVYPERHAKRPAVEAFLAWLHGEAAKATRTRAG